MDLSTLLFRSRTWGGAYLPPVETDDPAGEARRVIAGLRAKAEAERSDPMTRAFAALTDADADRVQRALDAYTPAALAA